MESNRAFVEIDDKIEGILTMPWMTTIRSKKAILKAGEELDVLVIGINRAKRLIRLSSNLGENDAWNEVARLHPVGSVLIARVLQININNGTAFVESGDGLRGVLPGDAIPASADAALLDPLERGQTVYVRVTSIDPERRHVRFTMKDVPAEEWTAFAQRSPLGTEIVGTVAHDTKTTVFVTLAPGVEGFLPRAEAVAAGIYSWTSAKSKKTSGPAHRLPVKIVSIDFERRRIDLTIP